MWEYLSKLIRHYVVDAEEQYEHIYIKKQVWRYVVDIEEQCE